MPFNPEDPEGVQIAVISGNPATGAFQALAKFPAGAESGLHSHTANYLAVGISGDRQRGAARDAPIDLPAGSYWNQPGGEVHWDNCGPDAECIIYIAMDAAADFIPAEAPGEGEPGMTHVAAADIAWMPMDPEHPEGPQMALIAGGMEGPMTALLRFEPGHDSGLHTHTSHYTGVVLTGTSQHGPSADNYTNLSAGSFWTQPGGEAHQDACTGEETCTLFIQMDGPFDMTAVE